ncbi:hypothetical protein [Kribbella sp. VKM Ac-2568]|uniref:hypothetical protein n=1 Tax=Kribbella sp. VKM Ac-2568 TaxID=2512219 RepID=UPI0013053814|nr:hypothetical protein [Kribbella sp. VKM Ac-2568]
MPITSVVRGFGVDMTTPTSAFCCIRSIRARQLDRCSMISRATKKCASRGGVQ